MVPDYLEKCEAEVGVATSRHGPAHQRQGVQCCREVEQLGGGFGVLAQVVRIKRVQILGKSSNIKLALIFGWYTLNGFPSVSSPRPDPYTAQFL